MAGTNRVGRVSSIDYESGTYEVTYADQGRRVTARINAMSNGEYKMPSGSDRERDAHEQWHGGGHHQRHRMEPEQPPSGGLCRALPQGIRWKAGQAFERYDANTGIYTQYTDVRTGRNCNGDIFDEAKGTIS